MDKIPLSDLIELVTSELLKAEQQAKRRANPIMEFQECELEMAIEVETGASGEANVWVFKVGGSAKKTDSNTIRIKFSKTRSIAFVANADDSPGPELG